MIYPICGLPKDHVCDWKTNIVRFSVVDKVYPRLPLTRIEIIRLSEATDLEVKNGSPLSWAEIFARNIEKAHGIEE